MKTLKILMLLFFLLWYFQRSLAGYPLWLSQLQAPGIGIQSSHSQLLVAEPPRQNPDFCKQYKRQEITGWVLLGAGAGTLAGGSYMIYKGVTNALNANSTYNIDNGTGPVISKRDITFIGVGSALALVGLVLTPTGLSLGITGTVRNHKYCGGSGYLISPALDSNGLGVSAKF